ncbi:MAG: hormogonium polysaccharide secretion pseudopilin HpsB [Microcoleaceae cyanobacterium MO_207.B10]|nr:hormogonium polysaccharide secretion pseudopilin HpsB [Microcoleaceae cyanobacterium MO_207.B10]
MRLTKKRKNSKSPEAGYTIIEGLVAMIMVSTLMAAIAPIIALSVGTRVQARRVELAVQAGRSYIDGVRSGTIPAPGKLIGDETLIGVGTLSSSSSCTPTDSAPYCNNPTVDRGTFYCVDGDGGGCTSDSLTDMMVHAAAVLDPDTQPEGYRKELAAASDNAEAMAEIGYLLSVRVYRASAFKDASKISTELPTTTVNNTGLATRDGTTEKPLFVTVTEIAPNTRSFNNYKDFLDR